MGGECDCGKKLYPFSREKQDAENVLRYLNRQWQEHHDQRGFPDGEES